MGGIEFILLAAAFIAVSNFLMRRSIDAGGSTKAYLMIQFAVMFCVAVLLNPVRTQHYEWHHGMALLGIVGGALLAGLMGCLGRALQTGPAALTFAVFNAATIMPAIVMVSLFGAQFGFDYSLWNGLGSTLVVIGLFWAARKISNVENKVKWMSYVLGAFALHVSFLAFMQWRALFLNFPGHEGLFLSIEVEEKQSQWFMPLIFLVAALIQTIDFLKQEKRLLKRSELTYGIFGGMANGIGTFFLIRATEVATSFEHPVLFPLLSVSVIFCCNMWAQFLYKEQVHWKASVVCGLGILIACLDWGRLL